MRQVALSFALVLIACAGPRIRDEPVWTSSAAPAEAPAPASRPVAPDRVAELSARVAAQPRLYPVWAQLGEARLDRARLSHDPAEVRAARAALETSLSIQENFEALTLMTALANFRHRFDEAIAFGDRAAQAAPSDTVVLSMRIEALTGLGRLEDAERLLLSADAPPGDFYVMTSMARLRLERDDVPGAIEAFGKAAEIARAREAHFFEAWANLRIAEQLIDSGQGAKAPPYLAAARRLHPSTRDLAVHEAEMEAELGRPAEAVDRFQALLRKSDDPFLHAAVVPFARAAGKPDVARHHFEAAEKGLLAIVDEGEVYSLETLATLYEAEGSHPDRAESFARRNFEHKRDASARQLVERLAKAQGQPESRR
jgi:tetratricopeptide (TPR) repeat protein